VIFKLTISQKGISVSIL